MLLLFLLLSCTRVFGLSEVNRQYDVSNWRSAIPLIKAIKPKSDLSGSKLKPSLPTVANSKPTNPSFFIQSTLKVNQRLQFVKVSSQSDKGEGTVHYICKNQSFTVRIPNVLTEEIITAKISKVLYSHCEADVLLIENKSDFRVDPLCSVAMHCGGCQLQYQTYQSQLNFKLMIIKRAFNNFNNTIPLLINDVVPSISTFNYRSKAQFTFQKTFLHDNQHTKIGLYKRKTHDVVDTDRCEIQHENVNIVISKLKLFFSLYPDASVYNETTGQGSFRHVVVRVGFVTDQVMVCLVTASTKNQTKYIDELVGVLKTLDFVKSILHNYNPETTDNVLNTKPTSTTVLDGKSSIDDVIAGIKVKVSLFSFTQSNPQQAAILYNTVLKLINLKGNEIIYDLYCGVGVIGLYLSQHLEALTSQQQPQLGQRQGRVLGVEDCKEAVDDALQNKAMNAATNIDFVHGKAEHILSTFPSPVATASEGAAALVDAQEIVVLNPPRKGVHELLLREISRRRVAKIIYVSCNPQTMARDLSALIDLGYQATTIQPVDMFPHTVHVETVALLERVNFIVG